MTPSLALEGAISAISNFVGQGIGNIADFFAGNCTKGFDVFSAIGSGLGTITGGKFLKPFKLDKVPEGVAFVFFTGAGERLAGNVRSQLSPR